MGNLEKLDKQHMEKVSKQMVSAAKDLGITLAKGKPTQGMVYASCFHNRGYVLAAALIADIEKVTLESMEKGAVVGIVYLQFPSIPMGFYKLQIVKTAARFIDKSGHVVAEMPVTVTATKAAEGPKEGIKITSCSVDVIAQTAIVDGHWGKISFVITIKW
jgi:hypothetical protein